MAVTLLSVDKFKEMLPRLRGLCLYELDHNPNKEVFMVDVPKTHFYYQRKFVQR